MSDATYVGFVRQGKIELRDAVSLPDGRPVYVVVPDLLDEHMARRKANRWLIDHVGNMIMADQGVLQQLDDQVVWRFGAFITSSSHPPRGPIGYVDVNAAGGQILSDAQTAESLIAHGQSFTGSTS